MSVRDAIYRRATRALNPVRIPPAWAIALRALLYPVEFARWRLADGYNAQRDEWVISGVRYSGAAMQHLAKADGVYRIRRVGDVVWIEEMGE